MVTVCKVDAAARRQQRAAKRIVPRRFANRHGKPAASKKVHQEFAKSKQVGHEPNLCHNVPSLPDARLSQRVLPRLDQPTLVQGPGLRSLPQTSGQRTWDSGLRQENSNRMITGHETSSFDMPCPLSCLGLILTTSPQISHILAKINRFAFLRFKRKLCWTSKLV